MKSTLFTRGGKTRRDPVTNIASSSSSGSSNNTSSIKKNDYNTPASVDDNEIYFDNTPPPRPPRIKHKNSMDDEGSRPPPANPEAISIASSSFAGLSRTGGRNAALSSSVPPRPGSPPLQRSATTSATAHPPKKININTFWAADKEFERKYDLTPVHHYDDVDLAGGSGSYTVDPWEQDGNSKRGTSSGSSPGSGGEHFDDEVDGEASTHSRRSGGTAERNKSKFLLPGDIHPNMEHKEDEIAQLRLLAGKLSADWRGSEFMAPALARRIRDFQFAQEKRRKKYGDERPWGILGLYDHLSSIRTDVEWAEDANWRRANGEPYQSWADFDESKKGRSNRPVFTYFILTVCTVIMIASISMNGWKVEPISGNPMIGPSAETLIKMGAKQTKLIVEESEGWRLLSSAVLHAGLVHYLINMLALWFVGGAIESSHGWFAAATIFTLSALGGAILSAIFLPEYITVGASGGIFGFIGACIADILANWKLLFSDHVTEGGKKHRHIFVVIVLVLDIALNSIIGLTPFVDNFTHLGGMVYGFLCGLSTMERLSSDFFGMEEGWVTRVKRFVIRFFGLIISVVALIVTLTLLLNMDPTSNLCPGCTWLSCVPFPPWESEANKWWFCDECNTITAEIVQRPYRHLELDCPGGFVATVNITAAELADRKGLQKKLPTYCRSYCPITEEL